MRGLFRFYPDEVVAATVVAEARGLAQLWYLPHKEFVTAFYNRCLATWSQKSGEFTELTRMQQFVRGYRHTSTRSCACQAQCSMRGKIMKAFGGG